MSEKVMHKAWGRSIIMIGYSEYAYREDHLTSEVVRFLNGLELLEYSDGKDHLTEKEDRVPVMIRLGKPVYSHPDANIGLAVVNVQQAGALAAGAYPGNEGVSLPADDIP